MPKQDAKSETETTAAPPEQGAPPAAKSGIMAWLPLIVAIVVMPVLAYAVTSFVLVPKLRQGLGIATTAVPTGHEGGDAPEHGKTGGHGEAKKPGDAEKVPMSKLLVNVSGTMGSRYLLASLTLVGGKAGFTDLVNKHEAQLRDMACGLLAVKTIADLEKPGSRNIIRTELLSGFNQVLGGGTVQEIYFTEFAIQ